MIFSDICKKNMKFNSKELIENLIIETNSNLERVKKISHSSIDILNHKENKEKWSVLECIEHLNLYGDFYLPELKKSISNTAHSSIIQFKSGFIGNYFVNSMLPKAKLNKMKTPRDKNPSGSNLDLTVIDRFYAQQTDFLEVLELAKHINLTKTKTAISISTVLKLRLGDTLRFLTAHNDRHILQAENLVKN